MAETKAELIAQGVDVTTTLAETEKTLLAECESVIQKGLGTFLEVGRALAEIRDQQLYRETHKTFEKYCKDVWDLSRGRAYQQIGGYETVSLLEDKMSTIVDKNPPDIDTITEEKGAEDACLSCEHRKAMANRAFKGVTIPGETPGKCTRPEGLCEKVTATDRPGTPQEILLPANEAQARAIRKLKDPDDLIKCWGLVLDELNTNPKAKLTTALINKKVKAVQGKVVREKREKKVQEIKEAADGTSLLSKQFKNQHQVMTDIIVRMMNEDFANDKRSEVIKHLEALVKLAKSDD